MFEAQKALLSPTLRYRTDAPNSLVAETKLSIVPAALILLILVMLAFTIYDPMLFWITGGVSLIAGPMALSCLKRFDKIIIRPEQVVYERRRLLSGVRSVTARREVFRGVRLTEYVTENDSRFVFYDVELVFSGNNFPKIFKVLEARDFGKAQVVALELCRILSVELETTLQSDHGPGFGL